MHCPVALFVYNRPEHTRKSLQRLNANRGINDASLYIFSDGPKDETQQERVTRVRELIRQKNNFFRTEIIESETNKGLANSIISGVSAILERHKRVAVLEDDVLTSPAWFEYMSTGLQTYLCSRNVWSVGAYCPPLKLPASAQDDVFLSPLATSYSWGTWHDRWQTVDWQLTDIKEFWRDKTWQDRFHGWDRSRLRRLKRAMRNPRGSWAIRWEYAAMKHSSYHVLPRHSLVTNIGYDIGEHSISQLQRQAATKYSAVLHDTTFTFPEQLTLKPEIIDAFAEFYHINFLRRFIYNAYRLSRHFFARP